MLKTISRLWADEFGQDLVEYSLLLGLLAMVVVVALRALGPIVSSVFSDVSGELNALHGSTPEATCCD